MYKIVPGRWVPVFLTGSMDRHLSTGHKIIEVSYAIQGNFCHRATHPIGHSGLK